MKFSRWIDNEEMQTGKGESYMLSKSFDERFEIRIQPIDYDGSKRIDARLWLFAEEKGEYIPTKKGFTVRYDQLEKVRADFERACEVLRPAINTVS